METFFLGAIATATVVMGGWVVSMVTDPEEALVIADAMLLPARSAYVLEKATAPLVSASATVTDAMWLSGLDVL